MKQTIPQIIIKLKERDRTMKKFLLFGIGTLLCIIVWPQSVPDLPIAIGVGSAEVWGDSIYYFGGSTSWSGSTRYPTIYRYDGSSWQNYASMPDNDVWGISSAIRGDSAFVYGGYSFGNNKLRIYNFVDNTWEYAASSPNIAATSGHTLEYVNDSLYMFFNGAVYKYSIDSNTWSQGTTLDRNGSWLFSTVYQDEIYLVGWTNGGFYKYNPANDQWTQLADLPYFVTNGSFRSVDDKIYYVGGTTGSGAGELNSTLVYDVAANQWSDAGISLSTNRAFMADVVYKNNLYVIGGLDPDLNAVANVEFIYAGLPTAVETHYGVLENFGLSQNYPNPFSQFTNIRYTVPSITQNGFEGSLVTLKIFDVVGNEVATLVNESKPAGSYDIIFDASALSPGVYFCRLQAGSLTTSKKMYLIR
jgi:N-acetylneuraminic acid mutarotase